MTLKPDLVSAVVYSCHVVHITFISFDLACTFACRYSCHVHQHCEKVPNIRGGNRIAEMEQGINGERRSGAWQWDFDFHCVVTLAFLAGTGIIHVQTCIAITIRNPIKN